MYSARVIKSENVKMIDHGRQETSGFQKVNFIPAPDPSSRNKDQVSEMERLRLAFEEEGRQREAQAYARGVTAGRSQHEEKFRLEMQKTADTLDKVFREIGMLKQQLIHEAEEEIIRLSLHIAEKIVHHEIKSNPEVIHHVLTKAMENVLDRDNITIRLHPDDYHQLMAIKNDFLQNYDGLKNVVFQKDETVKQGGTIIETQHGEVDARIDQQLREVTRTMLAMHR